MPRLREELLAASRKVREIEATFAEEVAHLEAASRMTSHKRGIRDEPTIKYRMDQDKKNNKTLDQLLSQHSFWSNKVVRLVAEMEAENAQNARA